MRLSDNSTVISQAKMKEDKYQICKDLGLKASDILQSNFIIWVEGPSDRIYLRHWIKHFDEYLIEGVHNVIMFYGGRLLSHLTVESEAIDDFIALRSLNQNAALIMDSDREAEGEEINETKKRIEREFNKGRGISWVTAGREIENYMDHAQLQSAVQSIYSSVYIKPSKGGQFDHALRFKRKGRDSGKATIENSVDKVRVARAVCEHAPNLGVLDLGERVAALVEAIRAAN